MDAWIPASGTCQDPAYSNWSALDIYVNRSWRGRRIEIMLSIVAYKFCTPALGRLEASKAGTRQFHSTTPYSFTSIPLTCETIRTVMLVLLPSISMRVYFRSLEPFYSEQKVNMAIKSGPDKVPME
jgi:hypothetical protein